MTTEHELGRHPADRPLDLPTQRTGDSSRSGPGPCPGPAVVTVPRRARRQSRHGIAVVVPVLAAVLASVTFHDVWGGPTVTQDVAPGVAVILLAVAGRLVLRRRLHRPGLGRATVEVLAVGTEESVAALVRRNRRAPHHGWTIVGACTSTGTGPHGAPDVEGVPVLGDLDSPAVLARTRHFDVVSVGRAPGWTSKRLQQLTRDLEGRDTELVVEPGSTEVPGPRLHAATVDGPPVVRPTHPGLTGGCRFLKGALDRIVAMMVLVLIAPVMLALAVAVAEDGGPVFLRQQRTGMDGREFGMVRFRSTVLDEGAGVLSGMRDDPRTTAIGRVLRKYSLDELPQLFNVVTGSMSLVGPRPPLPSEVEGHDRRRLPVKPGMTGLWPLSGRSDLSWEESARLDLRYAETWTLALDARILVRTVRAIVRGGGAY